MIKVLNIKDVLKYLVKLTFILVIIVGATRYFSNIKDRQTLNLSLNLDNIRNKLIKMALTDTIPKIDLINEISGVDESYLERILGTRKLPARHYLKAPFESEKEVFISKMKGLAK